MKRTYVGDTTGAAGGFTPIDWDLEERRLVEACADDPRPCSVPRRWAVYATLEDLLLEDESGACRLMMFELATGCSVVARPREAANEAEAGTGDFGVGGLFKTLPRSGANSVLISEIGSLGATPSLRLAVFDLLATREVDVFVADGTWLLRGRLEAAVLAQEPQGTA